MGDEKRQKNKTITVRMGPKMHKTITERSKKYNVSPAEVIRQALTKVFNVHEDLQKIPTVID